ncbi:glycosyltransferase family 2 protein [Mycolicibacterium iranicum]|uniref:glycosyltransferase family 2 protein n=1 Tax=Mycolicibacterium iranicum TaxID=912594 RepID=UPI000A169E26|nr:glycosyltransferase family 2 protein [Mycolicibacterium iranicum]
MTCQPKYLVAVATYRRPDGLKRLLDSLALSVDRQNADVIVIDNDAAASARSIATEHPLLPHYEVEPDPGIASARNRALDSFNSDYSAVIFVDDDEWVDPDWYRMITSYAERTGAEVVQGSVVTILHKDVPHWISNGQFFQRPIQASGTQLASAATNNVLLTRRAWQLAGCPRFDKAFSTSGGSDFDLFWGLHKSGAEILYCAEATVYEDVSPSRLSWRWLRRRYTRNGMAIFRSHRKHGESMGRLMTYRFGVLIVGAIQFLIDILVGRGPRAKPVERVFKSVGVFASAIGYEIHEYSRSP